MATLLAISYPDPGRAREATASADWLGLERLLDVKAACWVSKEKGVLTVHPRGHPAFAWGTLGATLGTMVGLLFGVPVAGVVVGTAIGAHRGKHVDHGIDNAFIESIGETLGAGGSAIFLLVDEGADTGRSAQELAQYGGTVHSTDLSPEQLARFQAMLDEANQAMAASEGEAT
jgi:uncharacterized membrane protein